MVIGAQRSGTTTLLDALGRHPAIATAFPAETHFFDRSPVPPRWRYRAHFPLRDGALGRGPRAGGRLGGESSPYYLAHPTAIASLCDALPDVRLIALLRHPTDRAWSQWRFNVARGVEPLDFLAALDAEPDRLARRPLHPSPLPADRWHQEYSYLHRGHYAPQLDRARRRVGPDRLLVLRSEDLYQRPGPTVARVLTFLGLDPPPTGQLTVGHLNQGGGEALTPYQRSAVRPRVVDAVTEVADRYGIVLTEEG